MKHMKKLFGLLLAVVMVFAMSVSVFADESNTATVTVPADLAEHQFYAYQIFTGTQKKGSDALGDAAWGDGIKSDDFLSALKNSTALSSKFASCTKAEDVVSAMSELTGAEAEEVAKIAYDYKEQAKKTLLVRGSNTLAKGYYLIVDETNVKDLDQAANAALLRVTNAVINITKKTDSPSVEKKVYENVKTVADSDYGKGYNDVADYHMGDAVPFHLIGTIPDMTHYETYKYEFYDNLGNGFDTPDVEGIKVYLSTTKAHGDNVEDVTNSFEIKAENHEITVKATDLKKIVADAEKQVKYNYVIVEYSAVLNQNAEVGLPGNQNTVYLKYSNKPDQSGKGDTAEGKTPEDKVIVFTYELDVTKVDRKDKTKLLKDAEFKLSRKSDGKYAVVNDQGKVTSWKEQEANGSVLKSNDVGKFSVIGLDDGTYFLKETKAPSGYNKLTESITIKISATTENGQNWDARPENALKTISVQVANEEPKNGQVETGSVGVTVENSEGGSLPSTGGIGTTIFYVVGGILMAGAAILMITKKKMSNK